MIFEGSEKKLEIVVRDSVHLLEWPESRWRDLIHAAGADILSKIESPQARAYLLSESSLFVWDDRFTMITCGTTVLADSALRACEYIRDDSNHAGKHAAGCVSGGDDDPIAALFYERKNEYFPQFQRSDFFNDAKKLNQAVAGRAYRLGHADEHHLFLFHSDHPFRPRKTDTTLEILMYGLQGRARDVFNTPNQDTRWIREQTGIDRIFSGFTIDDHAFSPIGYSLNALNGSRYYTIHVTPQDESPYVSFETNLNSRRDIESTLKGVLEVFKPRAFDIVYFDAHTERELVGMRGYALRGAVREKLNCGFNMYYSHHSSIDTIETSACLLDMTSGEFGCCT